MLDIVNYSQGSQSIDTNDNDNKLKVIFNIK